MRSRHSRRRFLAGVGSLTLVSSGTTSAGSGPTEPEDDDGPTVRWASTFAKSEAVVDSVPAHDGGVVVAVHTSPDRGVLLVARVTPSGDVAWQRRYGTAGRDEPRAIRRVSDGYVVAGWAEVVPESYDYAAWLLRLDSKGRKRWQRRYTDVPVEYQANSLAVGPGGGFLLAGNVDTNDQFDSFALKTDGRGRIQWRRNYNRITWVTDVAADPTGGYVIAGHTHRPVETTEVVDGTLLGVGSDGTVRWTRHYGGADADRLRVVLPTETGFLVAGKAHSPVKRGALLAAVDQVGTPIWRRSTPVVQFNAVAALADGYLLAGHSADRKPIVRTDRWGRVQWAFGQFSFSSERAETASVTPDGVVFVGGSGDGIRGAWLVVIDP